MEPETASIPVRRAGTVRQLCDRRQLIRVPDTLAFQGACSRSFEFAFSCQQPHTADRWNETLAHLYAQAPPVVMRAKAPPRVRCVADPGLRPNAKCAYQGEISGGIPEVN
jgi:hypothetical protein